MAQGSGADTVQQIKDKLSIVEVVQPYVKLVRAGKYWRGLSPFAKEKTPSFYVSPDRGSYYCFSTSQGGDHFTFIEKMEGVDFKGALKILAQKAGVEIQQLRPEDRVAADKRDRVREAMAEAETYFASELTPSSDAYAYATSRGLTPETIKDWKLGLAPSGWRGLLEAFTAKGYSSTELKAAGLVKEADEKPGTWYDRFRNRLMFPIHDAAGRTVAFTGRALDPADQAKYLNSPETELFKKSEVLFGMDRAKDSMRSRGFAILVEGQFDLLLLHQAGFTNTIALSGTALSSQHLSLIKRYADNLMLCLDADRAGLAASAKNAHAALSKGMRVKAVRLPEGKDPADIVSGPDGAKVFTDLVKNSQSVIEFFLAVLISKETDDGRLIRRIESTVLPLLKAIQSPLEVNRNAEIISRAIGSTADAVLRSLQSMPDIPQDAMEENLTGGVGKIGGGEASTDISALESRRRLILGAIQAYPNTPLAERLKSEYSRIIGAPAFSSDVLEGLDERAHFEAGLAFAETPSAQAGDDLLHAFERMILRDALKEATVLLRKAEATGDTKAIHEAALACKEISTRISALP